MTDVPESPGCPSCGAPRERWMGHEVRGVYDGVLFWSCAACGHAWNRWPQDHPRWSKAEEALRMFVAAMGVPPLDMGSDRYDYIEVQNAPHGVAPPAALIARLDPPCGDCRANLFIRYVGTMGANVGDVRFWKPTIAHDEGCPTLTRIERGDS